MSLGSNREFCQTTVSETNPNQLLRRSSQPIDSDRVLVSILPIITRKKMKVGFVFLLFAVAFIVGVTSETSDVSDVAANSRTNHFQFFCCITLLQQALHW